MILEQVAIDFRCLECRMIRRVDADLGRKVSDQLPTGWTLESLGVCCPSCTTSTPPPTRRRTRKKAEPVPVLDEVKAKADEKREEVRKLRMPTAETTSLESPVTAALSPLVSDTCTRCNAQIGETESWRPDPEVAGFAKAHRQCLLSWAEKKAQAAALGMIPEDPM